MEQNTEQQGQYFNYLEHILPVQVKEQWEVSKPLDRHGVVPEFSDANQLEAITLVPARGETLCAHNINRHTGLIKALPFSCVERRELYPGLSTKYEFENLMHELLSAQTQSVERKCRTAMLKMGFTAPPAPAEKHNYEAAHRILELCQLPSVSCDEIMDVAANARHKQLFGLVALL